MIDDLRKQAERHVKADETTAECMSLEEIRRELHELEIHKVELEMQNEELRRTHHELEEVRARYFDLYDLAPVGYVTLSDDGLILEANLSMANLLGAPRSLLIKQSISRFFLRDDLGIFQRLRTQLVETGEPQTCELRMVRNDTESFWARIQANSAQPSGGPVVHRIVITDVTERKQAEQFHKDVERTIRHDLKSPLIALYGMADLALNGKMHTDLLRLLPGLKHAIRNAIHLVDSSDKILQMEYDTYTPETKCFNIQDVASNIALTLNSLIQAKRIRLTYAGMLDPTAQQEKPLVFGEEFLVESMLTNLVKNAVEASPRDSEVAISCRIEKNEQRIDIHNLGVVPETIRGRFFEKFATAGKNGGSGLGTYSAQHIAKAHGGHIEFTTSEDEGTTVTAFLALPR